MKTKILNGILCVHDVPIESYTFNEGILFLHNERKPLAQRVAELSDYGKISLSYFVSEDQQTEEEAIRGLLNKLYGRTDVDIGSNGTPYSEVTPDLCWSHDNKFKIGGHNMNRELSGHVGKWILIRIELEELETQ